MPVTVREMNDGANVYVSFEVGRGTYGLTQALLYFDNDRFWSGARGAEFGAPPYAPFWEAVQDLGIPLLWDIWFVQRRTQAAVLATEVRHQQQS